MKTFVSAALAFCIGTAAMSQTFHLHTGGVDYRMPASAVGEMTLCGTDSVNVLGRHFALADIDSLTVDEATYTPRLVDVDYDGNRARITVDAALIPYLTITPTGAKVCILQNADVSDQTCGEITYRLAGQTADGGFELTGDYKTTVVLAGLDLTNTTGAAINVANGKRIKLKLVEGTTNSLTDAADGTWKGCFTTKGHLEMGGGGALTINGHSGHGVHAKEYIEIKDSLTLVVASAAKDAIHAGQYIHVKGGALRLSGMADDAIQVEFKDSIDREADDTGAFKMTGGSLTATVTAAAAKAIKADGPLTIEDGTLALTVEGGGTWDATEQKTKAAACLSADSLIHIAGGTLSLTATGSGGKGIKGNAALEIGGGETDIKTSGGLFAYVNNTANDNYTGNTDNLSSSQKSSPKGIKCDGIIHIAGGLTTVETTGNGAEGIESKQTLTVDSGTVRVKAYDDAINASSHIYINGGNITAIATNNDGIDANGSVYVAGGYTMAFGSGSPECGIDANSEEGYTVYFTGGTLLAMGGSNSTPTSSESTQAYVSGSASVSAGTEVSLKSGDTVLATFTIPENYTSTTSSSGGNMRPGGGMGGTSGGSSMLITCPGLTSGSSYTLTAGSSSSSVTAAQSGSSGGMGRP
ncbi:MAG: carbohydrate-binding domain-containing protein [Alloprevotella sp.]